MNAALVDRIVKAVLYEGYMLYPYRPSAIKNRQRFNFGVIYPRAYSEAQAAQSGTDAWMMQTQCLVQGSDETQCQVRVRFLRMVERCVGKVLPIATERGADTAVAVEQVESLDVDGKTFRPWQEAVEEVIDATEFNLPSLAHQPMRCPFEFLAETGREEIPDRNGVIVGIIARHKAKIAGMLELSAEPIEQGLYKLTVRISNNSRVEYGSPFDREEVLRHSLVSAHTILQVRNGDFISLIDPPDACQSFADKCQNVGTWPILVGDEGQRDTMLSSPIILYDYPEIAPESPGDLFDGGEIDEILSLRIMTMTDEEKKEMREADDRTRQILERTEALPEEQLMKLHGVLRGLRNAKEETP